MAEIVIRKLVDDLDKSRGKTTEVDSRDRHTLRLDNREVVLDLGPNTFGDLEDMLAVYFKVGTSKRTKVARPSRDRERNIRIREWAKDQPQFRSRIHPTGKIPIDIVEAYEAER